MEKKILAWIVWAVLSGVAIYSLVAYLELKSSSNSPEKKILYSYISKEVVKGGRTWNYAMLVLYKGSKYQVDITQKAYEKIGQGILPELYYSRSKDYVFTKWEVGSRLQLVFLCLLVIGITLLPLEKWEQKLRGR